MDNFEKSENRIHIYCKNKRKVNECLHCLAKTDKLYDYHKQVIKDIPALGKEF